MGSMLARGREADINNLSGEFRKIREAGRSSGLIPARIGVGPRLGSGIPGAGATIHFLAAKKAWTIGG